MPLLSPRSFLFYNRRGGDVESSVLISCGFGAASLCQLGFTAQRRCSSRGGRVGGFGDGSVSFRKFCSGPGKGMNP